jgi:hypothetical protein
MPHICGGTAIALWLPGGSVRVVTPTADEHPPEDQYPANDSKPVWRKKMILQWLIFVQLLKKNRFGFLS